MKLLFFISDLGQGGAEKLIIDVALLLKRKGHDVEILVLQNNNSIEDNCSILKKGGILINNLNVQRYLSINAFRKLYLFFQKNRYDIIHVNLFPPLYLMALIKKLFIERLKLVFTEHSAQNSRRGKKYLRGIERLIYNEYDAIISVSGQVKVNLEMWLKTHPNIINVPNGIDNNKIHNASIYDIKSVVKTNHKNPKFILMVSRFEPPKDHLTLIKALNLLPPSIFLLLAGNGRLQNQCKEIVTSLGLSDRVFFLGYRNDAINLMKSVDINILSSDFEGQSGVAMESLASGKPFLGSDVPGINEIVPSKDFLFSKGDEIELARKIVNILTDENISKRMCDKTGEYALKYDINETAEGYNKVFYQLL
jgi:glycosyltransferase involved in cell wall biosynthesis